MDALPSTGSSVQQPLALAPRTACEPLHGCAGALYREYSTGAFVVRPRHAVENLSLCDVLGAFDTVRALIQVPLRSGQGP